MDNETFFKKKQLLRKRDDLLEEIGQSLFDDGELPKEFEDLPHEFEGMDILLGQLKDHYRALREERDRAHFGLKEQLELMINRDQEFDRQLEPLGHATNKITLKIQVLRDQLGKKAKNIKHNENLRELTDRQAEMSREVADLEIQKAEAREQIQKEVEPLEVRIHKLDIAIRKIQNEEDQLSSNRRKRLRALGFWYHNRKPDRASFGARFGQLKLLRLELAETSRKKSITPDPEPEPIEEGRSWGRLIFFFAVVAAVVFFLRTKYRVEDIPLSGIAASFLAESRDYRVFANLDRISRLELADDLPPLAALPGGKEVFSEVKEGGLQSFLISRQGSAAGEINFCGLRFREPPPRFGKRLVHLGWDYLLLSEEWQALTKDDWVWVVFSEKEFFLVPSKHLAEFQALDSQETDDDLFLRKPVLAFNANHALLHGFDQVQAIWRNGTVLLHLRAEQPQADLALRRRYVRGIGLGEGAEGVAPRFENDGLKFEVERERFVPKSYSAEGLRSCLRVLVDEILDGARKVKIPKLEETAAAKSSPEQNPGTGQIRVFGLDDGAFLPISSITIPEPVDDLIFRKSNHSVLTLEPRRGAIRAYNFVNGNLIVDREWAFADLSDEWADFQPQRLVQTPDESRAVLLENGETGSRDETSRLVLLSLVTMTPLYSEPLPAEVRRAVSAVWDPSGQTLYVSCAVRGSNGAFGVLVYRLENETLEFARLLGLPRVRSAMEITNLSLEPYGEALYMFQFPPGRLIRYNLADESLGFLKLVNRQRAGKIGAFPLVLSRSGRQALLFEPQEDKSSSLIHMVSLAQNMERVQMSLDALPQSAIRIPLSDKFWLAAPSNQKLIRLRLRGELVRDSDFSFEHFSPRLLVSDTWGNYLIVAGKRIP